MSKNRTIASLISNDTSKVKQIYTDSDSIITSVSLGVTAAAGTATYTSADTLPTSADDGDQALVTSTNRLYIYSGSGWYNIALVNTTPYFTTSAAATYDLSTTGAATTITLLAVDSEGINIVYTATADSDFDGIATLSRDSDNGRIFTITPTDSENGTAVTGTGTITFKASDGVNVASTLSTFNLTFITTISNSNYTTLLSKADTNDSDNQVDASTNNYTITETGNVTSSAFSPYHPGGYSTYFDGAAEFIEGPSVDLMGSGAFTVECWVKILSNGTSYTDAFLGQYQSNSKFILGVKADVTRVWMGGSEVRVGTTNINANGWHHIALVRNASNSCQLYVDGSAEGAAFTNTTDFSASLENFEIGSWDNGANSDLHGYIKDLRVVKGTAVYTSAFTSPTAPLTAIANTSLLACHAPYIADGSSNNHALTVSSQVSQHRVGPYDYLSYTKADHGGSVYFDGTGDYITAGSASDASFSSGTFTIEFWMYLTTNYAAGVNCILSNYDGGANSWYIQIRDNGTLWLGASIGTPLSYVLSPEENRWYHIAFSNDASNSTGKMFVNGIEVDDHTGANYTSAHMGATTVPMTIGRLGNNTSQDFSGYISDIRIIDGTMLYTSNFTPPTEPLTAVTNTKLLTCTNKNDIWEQADGKPWTKVTGGPTVTNAQRKFTTSSALYFAGTTNTYLLKDLGETIGTRDFTAEAWVYPTTSGARHVFQISNQGVGYQLITSQNTQVGIGMNGGYWRYGTTGWNFGYVHTTTAVVFNAWHHVAYVRTGGYSKLYLNGTEIHSNADTINYSARYLAYGLGSAANNVWLGYIQGLRIALGYARYTSNFTPPTEEFEG